MKLKPIREQVVVLMGATSGIGRAAAIRFAAQGAKVVLAGRSLPELEKLALEIRDMGGRATPIAAEVTDYQQVKNVADHAITTFGRIDTWVHLAGVAMYATFEDTTPEEFRRVVDVNLIGQAYGAMAALPHIKNEGRGSIIHISSIESRESHPYLAAYAASKKGMLGFIDTLRMEMEHKGLPVNVVNIMPSSINTPFFSKARTKIGVKPQPYPPAYEPEVAADAILYAAEHPARDIIVGGSGMALSLMKKFTPRLADKAMGATGFKVMRSNQPKSADAPNNLYEHLEGFDRIQGEYTAMTKPASAATWLRTHPAARWAAIAGALGLSAFFSYRAIVQPRMQARSHNRLVAFAIPALAAVSHLVKPRRSLMDKARRQIRHMNLGPLRRRRSLASRMRLNRAGRMVASRLHIDGNGRPHSLAERVSDMRPVRAVSSTVRSIEPGKAIQSVVRTVRPQPKPWYSEVRDELRPSKLRKRLPVVREM